MLGPVKGGAVWLCGPDDDGALIITEGIEKAIACRHASGFQVWVALSASLMPADGAARGGAIHHHLRRSRRRR